jgi:hypothetical protein
MTYRLLLVAFSICSSRAVLAPEDHQDIIVTPEREDVVRDRQYNQSMRRNWLSQWIEAVRM